MGFEIFKRAPKSEAAEQNQKDVAASEDAPDGTLEGAESIEGEIAKQEQMLAEQTEELNVLATELTEKIESGELSPSDVGPIEGAIMQVIDNPEDPLVKMLNDPEQWIRGSVMTINAPLILSGNPGNIALAVVIGVVFLGREIVKSGLFKSPGNAN